MEKEYLGYNESLGIQEIGFDLPCFAYYMTDDISNKKLFRFRGMEDDLRRRNSSFKNLPGLICAPLYQQVFEFFREMHGFYINDFVDDDKTFGYMISYFTESGRVDKPIQRKYSTYPESQLACINQLINLVKEKI